MSVAIDARVGATQSWGAAQPELVRRFDLLAASPAGVQRLRDLVLSLAVQGKLLPQDPRDEPASLLLQRAVTEASRSMTKRRGRTSTIVAEIGDAEQWFALPQGWAWARLGSLGDWGAGATPSRSNGRYYGGSIPWFKSGELTADFISKSEEMITDAALADCSLRLNDIGDVLVAMYGATIGKTAILSVKGTTNQAVCACRTFACLKNTYLLVLLKALKPYFVSLGAGGAQPNISREKIVATVVGLPPLEEQVRIVARVDELMRLCDALEAKGRLEAEQHARLLSTLLGTLTDSATPEELAANWQRVADHFDLLLDRPEAVDALEQTILQLAVRGLLVPQLPSEEPASQLTYEPKQRRIGDARRSRDGSELLAEAGFPGGAPAGWKIVQLGSLIDLVSGQHLGPSEYQEGLGEGIPYLTGPAEFGELSPMPSRSTFERRAVARRGDILLTVKGSGVGKLNVVSQAELAISRQLMAVRPRCVDASFLFLVLLTMGEKFQSQSIGIAIPGIGREDVTSAIVGLPPLAEQTRIVARVAEMRRLCATLRERVQAQQTAQSRLVEALVEQALA